MLLRPAHIHAHEHVCPVLALGAAGAGVNFEIAVVGVGFARKQRFQLAPRHLDLQPSERRFRLGDGLVVFFPLAQLYQSELVFQLLLDTADRFELVIERIALAHDALGARLIVPEVGIFRLFV